MTTAQETVVKPDLTPRPLHVATDFAEWTRAWNASTGLSEKLGLLHDIFGIAAGTVSEEAVLTLIGIAESKEGSDMPWWAAVRMKAVTMLVRRVLKPSAYEKTVPEDTRFLRSHPQLVARIVGLFAKPLRFSPDARFPWRDDVRGFLMWCNTKMRLLSGENSPEAHALSRVQADLFKAMLRFRIDDVGRSEVRGFVGSPVWITDARTDLLVLKQIVVEGDSALVGNDWLKEMLGTQPFGDGLKRAAALAFARLKGELDGMGIQVSV